MVLLIKGGEKFGCYCFFFFVVFKNVRKDDILFDMLVSVGNMIIICYYVLIEK